MAGSNISAVLPPSERRRSSFATRVATHFWWLAIAVGVGCGLITARAIRGAGFRDDDLVNIGSRLDSGWGLTTFLGPAEARDHLIPGAAILSKVIGVLGPEWWMAQWFAALCVGVLVVVTAALLRVLTESSVVALVASALLGTSFVIVTVALWWTSASLQLPMLCAAGVTLLLAVRWSRTRSWSTLVLCVVFQVLACAFSDRAALLPGLVWAVVVLAAPGDRTFSLGRTWQTTKASLPLLVPLVVVVVTQAVLTVLLTRHSTNAGLSAASTASAGTWVDVVRYWWEIGVGSTMLNSFAGVWPFAGSTAGSTHGVIGLVVLGLLAVATVRGGRAAVIWLALAFLVTVSGIQIAAGRLATMGAQGSASVPRYQDLTILFVVILVPAAWVASGRPWPSRRVWLGVLSGVALVGGVLWAGNLRSSVQAAQPRVLSAATYGRNMRDSLALWDKVPYPVTLLDEHAPGYVVFRVPSTANYDLHSRVARIFAPGVHIPPIDAPTGRVLRIDAHGVARQVRTGPLKKVARTGPACGLASPGAVWLGHGVASVGGRIPAGIAASGQSILLSVAFSRANARGTVGLTAATGFPVIELPLATHPDGFRAVLPAGSRDISVQLWRGAGACIGSIRAARLISP